MKDRNKFTTLHDAVKFVFFLNFLVTVNAGDTYDTLGSVEFEAGDQILIPLMSVKGSMRGPYHALFAVSNKELVEIGTNGFFGKTVRPEIKKRDDLPDDYKSVPAKVVKPDPTRPRLDLKQAIALAVRMEGKVLPFHAFKCNCRHYADFLTYGKTYGSKSNLGYQPMNSKCPFNVKITATTDVRDKNFKLMDKKNREYRLLKPRITLKDFIDKHDLFDSDSDSGLGSRSSSSSSFGSGSSFRSDSSLSSGSSFRSGSELGAD